MPKSRKEQEAAEKKSLAPYAQKSGDTAGRAYTEPQHPFRTEYQRDRARIIHSKSFRRLENKTQVFLNGTGDHLRTRLTHTIEVASICRSIARSLGLNEDLAEAIALAHDLGHPPFGHSGEEVLHELMRGYGGFDHNEQSLRVVQLLESKYPEFPGLNLSFEVLEGLRKHARFHQAPGGAGRYTSPSLEAQIANLADEITYYSHDLDDGLDFHLIRPAQLSKLEVWEKSYSDVRSHFPKLQGPDLAAYVIRCIIDRQVEDVVTTSDQSIQISGVKSVAAVRAQKKPLIRYSERLLRANRKLRKFLYQNLYYHPRVAGANRRAGAMLESVFRAYIKKPALLGEKSLLRVPTEGLHRTVCDYLSGMTDRYLIEEYRRLFPKKRV